MAPRQKSTTTANSTTSSSTNHSPSIVSAAAPTYFYNLAQSFPASNPNHNTSNTQHTTYPLFMHMNKHNNSTNMSAGNIDLNDSLKSTASTMAPNPFLAKRTKSLNQRRDRPLVVRPAPSSPPPPPPPLPASLPVSAPHPYTALTMPYSRSVTMHCPMDKKFNSLKTSTTRKKPEFYSLRVSKCRRHHSPANPTYDVQQKLLVINNALLPYATSKRFNQTETNYSDLEQDHQNRQQQSPAIRNMRFNRQPLYENLVNSSLEHRGGDTGDPNLATSLDEYYCDITDANSIYRSDSGISNSSFELTPIPAPRNNPRNCQSAPVYVNLPKYVANNALFNKKHGTITTAFNYEVCSNFSLSTIRDHLNIVYPIHPINSTH